jgi:HSP20 family molecular chaperone IbpA
MKYRLNQTEPWRQAFMDRWRMHRFHPFHELTDMQSEINRAFDAYFGGWPRAAAPERAWTPPIDVYETRDQLVLAVELRCARRTSTSP